MLLHINGKLTIETLKKPTSLCCNVNVSFITGAYCQLLGVGQCSGL
jgi:hypothetical protein